MDEHILILLLLFSGLYGQHFCPKCETVDCISTIIPSNCSSAEYLETESGPCNCCPGCVSNLLGLNSYGCDNNNNIKCGPGLKCDETKICRINKTKCSHLQHIKDNYKWVPVCDQDATYKAVQCKGDRATGRCFCFSEQGDRIFGWDWWRIADEMACTCSRLRNKRELEGKISTLHCAHNGNFEELQCENNVCWCAEPITGEQQLNTIAVPSSMWMLLSCYNMAQMGEQYLRKCESGAHAEQMIKEKFRIRGVQTEIKSMYCDYDGSYASVHIEHQLLDTNSSFSAKCKWRDGSMIGLYGGFAADAILMDCNCARDQKIFGDKLLLQCDETGNYQTLQEVNFYGFCVDRDGYGVTELLSLAQNINCSAKLYYMFE